MRARDANGKEPRSIFLEHLWSEFDIRTPFDITLDCECQIQKLDKYQ
jgi:hypothetical protein